MARNFAPACLRGERNFFEARANAIYFFFLSLLSRRSPRDALDACQTGAAASDFEETPLPQPR